MLRTAPRRAKFIPFAEAPLLFQQKQLQPNNRCLAKVLCLMRVFN